MSDFANIHTDTPKVNTLPSYCLKMLHYYAQKLLEVQKFSDVADALGLL